MSDIQFANKGASTLAAPVLAGDLSITVANASSYPSIAGPEYFLLVLEAIDLSKFEVCKVTNVVSNTLTVVRAQGGTLAQAFAVGARAENRVTKTTLDEFYQRNDPVVVADPTPVAEQLSMFTSASTLAGIAALRFDGSALLAGLDVQLEQGVYFAERAPGPNLLNFGQLYVNAAQALIYRDELGAETNLLSGGGGGGGFSGLGIWKYSVLTTPTPAAGLIQFDNATISNANNLHVNVLRDDGGDLSTFLGLIESGDQIYLQIKLDASQSATIQVGAGTLLAGVYTFPITAVNVTNEPFIDGADIAVISTSSGGLTWSTPIDSNITVDTDSLYEIGSVAARHATIYAGNFSIPNNGNFLYEGSAQFGLKFSSVDEWAFRADRNGATEMFFNNISMLRTAIAASGGLEINNTVTGAGFERALTTSDLDGGTF